jgi:SAM-dependent methyltransferase
MLSRKDIDFGRTAKDYARHRAGFPASFFTRLLDEGFLTGAKAVLDLGTGTGTVARGLARNGFDVTGVDPARTLLESARLLDEETGVRVDYRLGTAEQTGLPSDSFDVVIAAQCWHWFEQMPALVEIERVVRPDGRLIIAFFDWLTNAGPVEEMRKLREKHNPAWQSGSWPLGFYPQKPGDLCFANWRSTKSFLYIEDIPYTHEAWRGRMRAYAGIGGSLPPAAVDAFDAEFADVLAEKFPDEPMMIPHRIWTEMWALEGQ